MGVKVGPQAFQSLVSWCVGRLKPHIRAYIDDFLVGKLLVSQAIMEHYKFLRELFEVFKQCHWQGQKEKCFLFYTQVKYVGHILPVANAVWHLGSSPWYVSGRRI